MQHFGPQICARCQEVLAAQIRLELGTLEWHGGRLRLTPSEARIFGRLLSRFATKEQLYEALYWDRPDYDQEIETVGVFVHSLRRKLSAAGFPGHIKTIWGRGYELIIAPAPASVPA